MNCRTSQHLSWDAFKQRGILRLLTIPKRITRVSSAAEDADANGGGIHPEVRLITEMGVYSEMGIGVYFTGRRSRTWMAVLSGGPRVGCTGKIFHRRSFNGQPGALSSG